MGRVSDLEAIATSAPRAMHMTTGDEAAQRVIQIAMAHGLVDDLMQEFSSQSDLLDLVNRLLLSDVIDTSEAIGFIQLLVKMDPAVAS